MTYNIKVRLLQVGKYQTDLIKELKRHNIKVSQSELSLFINGVENPPRSELVLSEADKILQEWEQK